MRPPVVTADATGSAWRGATPPSRPGVYRARAKPQRSGVGLAADGARVPSNDLINPDPGNNANFYEGTYPTGNHTIGSPYWRTEVGEFENSDSPYGTFDQGGNVWEWNEAVIRSSRGVRGGSFAPGPAFLHAANRSDVDPTIEFGDIGFRIAFVPEPATLGMWALGLVTLLRRRPGAHP